MNTNSNTYTVIYTSLVVVLVAALLAFVSESLKDKQVANEKAETISQILTAAQFGDKDNWSSIGNAATIEYYKNNISAAYRIDGQGAVLDTLDSTQPVILSTSDLKKQNYAIAGKGGEIALPVYVFTNGVTVIPVYGAGLWGPVWGYLAFNGERTAIIGAYFDHASETPGLGGKIQEDPAFRAQFAGKKADYADEAPFHIVKGGAPEGKENAIDAITGATMTSKGLAGAINNWLNAYKPLLNVSAEVVEEAVAEAVEAQTVNVEE